MNQKTKVHAVRFSTNERIGITRASFIRGLERMGDPIFVPVGFRDSILVKRIVKEWLGAGEAGLSDRKARRLAEDLKCIVLEEFTSDSPLAKARR